MNLDSEMILTPNQQRLGRSRYLWFTRINALSFGCLAESILILYAIKNGADDFLVGMLTSFFYLTMPFMFFGKRLVSRLGAARTYGFSWAFRNLSASTLILVPIAAKFFSPKIGLVLLILAAFGFFGFRSMGMTATTPLIGEITTRTNRGNFISQTWLHFNLFYLFAMVAMIFILGRYDHMHTFQGIIFFGVVTGVIAASVIYRVPETNTPRLSAQKPIGNSFSYIIHNPRPRKLLYAWAAAVTADILVNPFSMVALKNGYQISDYNALFYALIQIVGGIVAAFINSVILDRVGPRPMLILYSTGFGIICLFWLLAPASLLIFHVVVIFFMVGLFHAGAHTTLSHYFLTIIPEPHRVGTNMFMFITSGVSAGLAGTWVGGGMLKILHSWQLQSLTTYRLYFLIILAIQILLFLVYRRIERIEEWRIKDVLGIFFSFRDIRALYTLYKLENNAKVAEEALRVEALRESPSELSEATLRELLGSPRFTIRGKALGALGRIRFGTRTTEALIKEVAHGEFTTAYLAAEILGETGRQQAIPVLRQGLQSADVYLQGKCLLALAQIGDQASYPEIEAIFNRTTNPRLIIHGASALVCMGDRERLPLLLLKSIAAGIPAQVREEVLFSACEMYGCGDEFYQFLRTYKKNVSLGLRTLQEIIYGLNNRTDQARQAIEARLETIIKHQGICDGASFYAFLTDLCATEKSAFGHLLRIFLSTVGPEQLSVELALVLMLLFAKTLSQESTGPLAPKLNMP